MKKMYISLFITISLIFVLLLVGLNNQIAAKQKMEVYDNLLKILTYYRGEEEKLSLSIAISLSQNEAFRQAILDEDEEKGFAILKDSTTYLSQFVNSKNLYAQILTKDLFVLARSWDPVFSGMPLEDFRDDLKEVLETGKPKVEIEVGRLLSIKATSPITHKDEMLGMLEIVVLLDTLVDKMRNANIELLPIMDTSFIDKAYLMEQNEPIQKEYVVVNRNFNYDTIKFLNQLPKEQFKQLKENNFISFGDYFICSYAMQNSKNKELGKFLMIIKNSDIKKFSSDQSSFIANIINMGLSTSDIYDITKQADKNVYLNIDKGYISNIHDNVDKKDLLEFEEVATQQLSKLSKEELIDFILHKSKHQAIEGEIK